MVFRVQGFWDLGFSGLGVLGFRWFDGGVLDGLEGVGGGIPCPLPSRPPPPRQPFPTRRLFQNDEKLVQAAPTLEAPAPRSWRALGNPAPGPVTLIDFLSKNDTCFGLLHD